MDSHFSALIAYTTTVNPDAVISFLGNYGVQIPENTSIEAIKQYVSQVVSEHDGAMEAFTELHPEKDDFAKSTMNDSQTEASTSYPAPIPTKTEKFWNEKRIKISVLVALMATLAVILALKFE